MADSICKTVSMMVPRPLTPPPAEEAWTMALQDKKIRGGNVVFVLIEDKGQGVIKDDVTQAELEAAIKRVRGDGS
jgi:3-dehydroquinate synthetase